jgi:hypothetical protein
MGDRLAKFRRRVTQRPPPHSGWEGICQVLKKDGYDVSVVKNPIASQAIDVAATHAVIDALEKSVILVGHSYGGVAVTAYPRIPRFDPMCPSSGGSPEKSACTTSEREKTLTGVGITEHISCP